MISVIINSNCNFQDPLNPFCICCLNAESTSHYVLHCPLFVDERKNFRRNIKRINYKFQELNDSTLTQAPIFGNTVSSVETITFILNATFQYVLSTKRVEEAILKGEP